ncbi:hypothetical protein AGOR_G00094240 [Albula goreensis]|uniref:Uncharacterized protein n=1 Tax=Albula goreensis TaxID=1534307 RepID=A0A8T3DQ88_9TELE|nr:hypothetical protein AGOR_G00094240 [Albula goreensis]
MGFLQTLCVLPLLLLMKESSALPECGIPPLNTRIVGGGDAPDGNWPWQASIHFSGFHFCGGSLITDEWVMSAAHCFTSPNVFLYDVYLGRQSQEGSNPHEVSIGVIQIINHPDFDENTNDNDIALLRLASPVSFTNYIRPVCLAANDSFFGTGTESWITGWGAILEGVPLPSPQTLQEVAVPVIENQMCNNYIPVTDNMICSGLLEGGRDSCQGDSGGPMVSKQETVWVQSGIVSFGFGCARPLSPGVYTRVSRYQTWISSQISGDQPGFVTFFSNGTGINLTNIDPPFQPPNFYPFGILNGDILSSISDDGSSPVIYTNARFLFFGTTTRKLYVNNNGYLTFFQPSDATQPLLFPSYPREDIIAPLWTDLDNSVGGNIYFRQVTRGDLLQQATDDINQYFPDVEFNATWIFVATWDRVPYYQEYEQETTFQVVLISDGNLSFVLMNYGDIGPTNQSVQAGYDAINSTHHFQILDNLQENIIALNYTSNVNETGRWVFRTDSCFNDCAFAGQFYPFGVSSGDTVNPPDDDGSSLLIQLNETFPVFERRYRQLYVNNNGFISFDLPSSTFSPPSFPSNSGIDVIAPFWTDIDNRQSGIISYRQVTSGYLLQQATNDINQYFQDTEFSASWVFIATWDRVAYFPVTGTETSFQVVLISNGSQSFTLMNYGRISPNLHRVQAGYDTSNSAHHFTITGSSKISDLPFTSNVNVTGRWAFHTGSPCQSNAKAVLRVKIKAKSRIQNPNNPSLTQMIREELINQASLANITCST